MGDWCQTAVNHLTKEEMGNMLSLSSYSTISTGDKDGVLSLDESMCAFYQRAWAWLSVAAGRFETTQVRWNNWFEWSERSILQTYHHFWILYCWKSEANQHGRSSAHHSCALNINSSFQPEYHMEQIIIKHQAWKWHWPFCAVWDMKHFDESGWGRVTALLLRKNLPLDN